MHLGVTGNEGFTGVAVATESRRMWTSFASHWLREQGIGAKYQDQIFMLGSSQAEVEQILLALEGDSINLPLCGVLSFGELLAVG